MWKIVNEPGDYRILDDDGAVVFRGRDIEVILTHFAFALQHERQLRGTVGEEVAQLEKWADESRSGGWSTHQVDPMRRRADELRRVLMPGKMIPVPTT